MKKLYFWSLSLTFFLSQSILAQNTNDTWTSSSVHLGLLLDVNQFNRLQAADVLALGLGQPGDAYELGDFDESVRLSTGGGGMTIGFSFQKSFSSEIHQEIKLGTTLYGNKEAMVIYGHETWDSSVVFCHLHSELATEVQHTFHGNWGKSWKWYVGYGVNAGRSFGDQLMVIEGEYLDPGQHPSNQEVSMQDPIVFEAKRTHYLRLFVPVGMYYSLSPKISMGFDIRKGLGWQFINRASPKFIRKNLALGLGLRYDLSGE